MKVTIDVPEDTRIITISITQVDANMRNIRSVAKIINPYETSELVMGYAVETRETQREKK